MNTYICTYINSSYFNSINSEPHNKVLEKLALSYNLAFLILTFHQAHLIHHSAVLTPATDLQLTKMAWWLQPWPTSAHSPRNICYLKLQDHSDLPTCPHEYPYNWFLERKTSETTDNLVWRIKLISSYMCRHELKSLHHKSQ
jgi:hypothetical protein